MMKRKLPIGIQTFREIREDRCYYVDKTAWMRRLVDGGKHYFLSRPRRFGKSLLIDTLKELFEGNEALFEGLDVHEHWDWSACHPVLRFDFSGGDFKDPGYLHKDVMAQLDAIDERGLAGAGFDAAPLRFRRLIQALHEETGQRAVVLVDEYDRPILEALETPEVARANRDFLRGLYGVIKSSDAHLRFSFLTGVSKFSKVSLFSGLNNLVDITLDPPYSALCGYTESDLDTVFAPELPGLDRAAIRDWYNGYNWRGDEKVYNPFDILLLFRNREFNAYWFETGIPAFLVETLVKRRISSLALNSMVGQRRPAVHLRRGRHRDRGAAVPDRLSHHPGRRRPRRRTLLSAGLAQPRGAPEPEPKPAALPGEGQDAPGGEQASDSTACWRPTTSRGSRPCSMRSSPASRTSGTPTTTSRATRVTTQACSTPTSRGWGWTSRWRTARAMAAWTWWCVSTVTCTCSSFKVVEMAPEGAAMSPVEGPAIRRPVPGPGRAHLPRSPSSSARTPATWSRSEVERA